MHLIRKFLFLEKNNMGGITGASDAPCDAPHHRGCQGVSDAPHDAPMLFFDNLVKKLDILSTSNIDIYPSTLEICINNLLKLFFFGSGPPPTYAQYFQSNVYSFNSLFALHHAIHFTLYYPKQLNLLK